jgi:hypothetical protein
LLDNHGGDVEKVIAAMRLRSGWESKKGLFLALVNEALLDYTKSRTWALTYRSRRDLCAKLDAKAGANPSLSAQTTAFKTVLTEGQPSTEGSDAKHKSAASMLSCYEVGEGELMQEDRICDTVTAHMQTLTEELASLRRIEGSWWARYAVLFAALFMAANALIVHPPEGYFHYQ